MIDHTPAWTLPQLEAYLEATLRRMGINRDVRADQQGEPVFDVVRTGRKADGSLRIDLTVDLSGIGMVPRRYLDCVYAEERRARAVRRCPRHGPTFGRTPGVG
jgi:hypothetical protein